MGLCEGRGSYTVKRGLFGCLGLDAHLMTTSSRAEVARREPIPLPGQADRMASLGFTYSRGRGQRVICQWL
jgi:hypothetical protein